MSERWCSGCGQMFVPRPQSPRQSYCSTKSCQVARKLLWQKTKRRSDKDYAENQKKAAAAWAQRNPEHWQRKREAQKQARKHPEESSDRSFGRLISELLRLIDHVSSRVKISRSKDPDRFLIPLSFECTVAQAGEPMVSVTMRLEIEVRSHKSSPDAPQETTP